ncbi:hypothetical protein HMPREF1870_02225 [Bacteroidales bacterium KA00344]|nr:hypothetical protein HMPREF1870_02225 [Bacteroidales bacterium KA00344]
MNRCWFVIVYLKKLRECELSFLRNRLYAFFLVTLHQINKEGKSLHESTIMADHPFSHHKTSLWEVQIPLSTLKETKIKTKIQ